MGKRRRIAVGLVCAAVTCSVWAWSSAPAVADGSFPFPVPTLSGDQPVSALPAAVDDAVAGDQVTTASAFCLANPAACVAIVSLAGIAYATRSVWLPVVENWFHDVTGGSDPSKLPTSTMAGWTFTDLGVTTDSATVSYATTNATWAAGSSSTVMYSFGSCIDPVSQAVTHSGTAWGTPFAIGSAGGTTPRQTQCNKPLVAYQIAITDSNQAHLVHLWTNPSVTSPGTSKTVTVHCADSTGANVANPSITGTAVGTAQVPACPSGDHPTSITISDGSGNTDTITIPGSTDYPDCAPTGSSAPCKLGVWVDGTPCVVGASRCLNWTALDHSRLACHWGPYTVPLANCNMLERAYQTGGAPVTQGNTDGDPGTSTDTNGNPSTSASPAGGLPTTGTNPGGTPAPSTDVTSNGCTGLSWSWNPIDWVLTPVKCALQWAFVPSQTSINNFDNSINGTITGSALFGWFHVLSVWVGTLTGGGSGCQGPGIEWIAANDTTIHPFNACSGEVATIAGITRSFAEGLIILRGSIACLNAVASGFGWGLGLMRAKSAYDDHLAQSGST